jgi:WD40 repeat protein
VLRVGPPQLLVADHVGFSVGASASRDGRLLAVPQGSSTLVLHQDRPELTMRLGPQHDVRFSAVSPDGRWVVTCSHWHDGRSKSTRIWDASTGKQVHELLLEHSTFPRFSPDGRWLATSNPAGCHLWEVGTWRPARRFDPAQFAFSPDGRLLALNDVPGVIRLVEPDTGRSIARLTGPDPLGYYPACFTPDSTQLIAGPNMALCVRDLRLIRKGLQELGLDWDQPPYPEPASEQDARPLQLSVDLGMLQPKP